MIEPSSNQTMKRIATGKKIVPVTKDAESHSASLSVAIGLGFSC